MYRVLVPIDSSTPRASSQARTVATLPSGGERVVATLLHVSDDGERAPTDLESGQRALEVLESAGVEVETETRTGTPAAEVLATADERDVQMIVLGGRKRSPLGSLIFGSVSQAVLLDSARPVVVTGSEAKTRPSHRCQSCGETYYTNPAADITTCRNCGGSKVEATG